ncbi:MAG TPA: hypothetical protein VL225_04195, partial [Vicinamibacterales bacterium]|nr:hypothetical protein [Vicinamibacterales bacterium]
VSEQALCECRAAIAIASPMEIVQEALDHLIEGVRPSFEKVLDADPNGAAVWRRDRRIMLMQGAAIGTLGALIAKLLDPSAKLVTEGPLMAAFVNVKGGCDTVDLQRSNVEMLTKYCERVAEAPTPVLESWMHLFGTLRA